MRRILGLAILLCLTVASRSEAGDATERLFEKRFADHVPAWCLYTQSLPDGTLSPFYRSARSEEYRKVFGSIWTAMHHYCYGLE